MLMGLADLTGSFTGTIYLAKTGPESFESLNTEEKVVAFLNKYVACAAIWSNCPVYGSLNVMHVWSGADITRTQSR